MEPIVNSDFVLLKSMQIVLLGILVFTLTLFFACDKDNGTESKTYKVKYTIEASSGTATYVHYTMPGYASLQEKNNVRSPWSYEFNTDKKISLTIKAKDFGGMIITALGLIRPRLRTIR